METQTALVRADGGVVLHAVAAVHADSAGIVHPGNAELDHALRLHEALDQTGLLPLGVLVDHELKRLKHLTDSLEKFGLMRIALFNLSIHALQVFVCEHKEPPHIL